MYKRISLLLVLYGAGPIALPVVTAQDSTIDCAGSEGTGSVGLGPWSGQEEETFKGFSARWWKPAT